MKYSILRPFPRLNATSPLSLQPELQPSKTSNQQSAKLLPQTNPEESPYFPPTHRRKPQLNLFYASLIALAILLSLVITALTISHRPKPPTYETCGSTPSEARARGCTFDVMSYSWFLPACYDKELSAEFLALNWEFYWEANSTKAMPFETVATGEHHTWVTWRYHVTHCVYMFKKQHRAVLAGRPVDGEIAAYDHTDHCSKVILDESVPREFVAVKGFVKYPSCVKSY